jgi:hypothetical protein
MEIHGRWVRKKKGQTKNIVIASRNFLEIELWQE